MTSRLIYSVPNYLTLLRLALIPLFVFLLNDPTRGMVNAAIAVFIFAALTDYIDGFIARRWGAISDFGKILDPLADKILVISALVMLTSMRSDLYGEPWVPGPMVVLVMAREIWVTGLRAVAGAQGIIVAAGGMGKVKSFLQMFAIVLLLLHDYPLQVGRIQLNCQGLGIAVLAISLVFSYFSAVTYSVEVLRACRLVDVHVEENKSGSSGWTGLPPNSPGAGEKPRDEQIN